MLIVVFISNYFERRVSIRVCWVVVDGVVGVVAVDKSIVTMPCLIEQEVVVVTLSNGDCSIAIASPT